MFAKNSKGFSLMELMVAVAIIAVLSAIGLPSYKTFQAKARQKEGFNLLSGYFAAAIATRTEFGVFPGHLVATGYAPVGTLTYRLRVNPRIAQPPEFSAAIWDVTCISTGVACNCGGSCPNFKTWTEYPLGVIGASLGPQPPATNGPCPTLGAIARTDNTFVAGVSGVISTSASAADTYYMDHNKTMEMCQDGLK